MNSKNLRPREKTDDRYKWDIEAMMPDESGIEKNLEKIKSDGDEFMKNYSGRLTSSGSVFLEAMVKKDDIWRKLENIFVYARMKRDEDNSKGKYQALCDKCMSVIASVSASMSFFAPELLSSPEDLIYDYIKNTEGLEKYEFALADIMRRKAHVLTDPEENILARMSEISGAGDDIFTMLNNADIKFGHISDEEGSSVELTHGNYINFMESYDRNVRKNAYEAMYGSYKTLINTVATAYNINTKNDAIQAKIRKYPSSMAAALFGDNIGENIYDNLISSVEEYLPQMHRYVETRKKILAVDKLYMYDMYVPLIKMPKSHVTYSEAIDMMKKGLAPLGEEYISKIDEGIEQRWIDVYENEGKTSGAYSFGSYDSYPYILLNYTETLKDVFTLVHEMGHSIHSKYTRESQPFVYGGHSIFTAEVASTVNESLLMNHLLENSQDISTRAYLLNTHIEAFRTTLFRQTMFAEFEKITHREVESGGVLTADRLCEIYRELNRKYYGDAVEADDTIEYEWARIPHFYRAFYVYKYATGYSAATAISEKILKEGIEASQKYIEFLKTGESDYPIELLKIAGVDMSGPEPVRNAMKKFQSLIDEFEEACSNISF